MTVGKFCLSFSRVLGGVVDGINVNFSARACLNHGLRDAQRVCAQTKVGTVLKPKGENDSSLLVLHHSTGVDTVIL